MFTSFKSEICGKKLKKILKIFWGRIREICGKVSEDFIVMLWRIHANVKIFEEIFGRFVRNRYWKNFRQFLKFSVSEVYEKFANKIQRKLEIFVGLFEKVLKKFWRKSKEIFCTTWGWRQFWRILEKNLN